MKARMTAKRGFLACVFLSAPLLASALACNKVEDSSVKGFPKRKCVPADSTQTGVAGASDSESASDPTKGCSDSAGGPPGGFGGKGGKFERTHRVLIVGLDPRNADPNDPTIPKGLTPELILKGLEGAAVKIAESGTPAELCLISPVVKVAEEILRGCFKKERYDVIVVGAGIRTIEANVELLESVVNTTHMMSPFAAMGFNKNPVDSAEVAARILAKLDANKPNGKPSTDTTPVKPEEPIPEAP